jgi:hypothetical protein
MDDFLHRLRTGKDKRYDRSRRNYEPSQYRSVDRQNGTDRRKRGGYKQQYPDQANTTISKLLPAVKSLLETIAEDQKRLTKLEARKTAAMENIAVYLKKLSGYEDALDVPEIQVEMQETEAKSSQSIVENENEIMTPDKTLRIINNLREGERLSFEKIANYLNENEIPTPSGRGKWRGQTVSKLYK